jgi:DNA-binding IscR family transcriptional regulator
VTKTALDTWNFLADQHSRTHVSPTIRDVAENFGIGNHSAWKRVQKLVELGYVAPQNGKQGITLLMMPDAGKTLAEALREAGKGIVKHDDYGEFSLAWHSCVTFTPNQILATGWEAVCQ